MSQWITDRLPTREDAIEGYVWFWSEIDNKPSIRLYTMIRKGNPWMPFIVPDPYVKPKRWVAVWSNVRGMWTLRNTSYSDPDVHAYNIGLVCLDYLSKQDEHREAAERVAAIYEEVMP